jgi:hypothetical protein
MPAGSDDHRQFVGARIYETEAEKVENLGRHSLLQ